MRTKARNRIRAELTKRRINLGVDLWGRKGRLLFEDLGLEGVDQLLPALYLLDRQVGERNHDLRRMCGESPQARLLTTIPGVGYYIALLIVSEIGGVNRFPDSESLCSYAGVVPVVWSSGGSTHHGGITREGSGYRC